MQRREMLGALGLGTAAFTLAGTARAAQQQQQHEHGDHGQHLEVMVKCAEACARASSHCLEQLRKGGADADQHATALQHTAACEDFCILSAKLSACNSPLAHLAHEANAQACDACAKACEGMEDQVMKDCVEHCRQCAEVCRQMAHAGGHDH